VRVPIEEEVGLGLGVDAGGDDDGDDEAVDPEDPRHDDGDDGLHDELGAHDSHGRDADAALRGAVGGAHACGERPGVRDPIRSGRGGERGRGRCLHEKTRAVAAPRKPKKGAVSSPLKVEEAMAAGIWPRRSPKRSRGGVGWAGQPRRRLISVSLACVWCAEQRWTRIIGAILYVSCGLGSFLMGSPTLLGSSVISFFFFSEIYC
jgi:hypothetical protein